MSKRILKNFCLCGFLIAGCANATDGAGDVWLWDDNSAAPDVILDDISIQSEEPVIFDD